MLWYNFECLIIVYGGSFLYADPSFDTLLFSFTTDDQNAQLTLGFMIAQVAFPATLVLIDKELEIVHIDIWTFVGLFAMPINHKL